MSSKRKKHCTHKDKKSYTEIGGLPKEAHASHEEKMQQNFLNKNANAEPLTLKGSWHKKKEVSMQRFKNKTECIQSKIV